MHELRYGGILSKGVCSYSTKSDKQRRGIENNIIFRSLNFIKEVDDQQKILASASTESKIEQLIMRISTNEELLYLLALFHYECAKLGFTQNDISSRQMSWKFRLAYLFKLKPINNSFWDLCHLLELSNRKHSLSMKVNDLGLLDPQHFPKEVYQELQTGEFNGIDFKDVETVSFQKPQFTKKV
ncbi:uncharacterized protein RJT21DRAFT_1321 [Scheffersomyces amazonensis]|uniref:uncharacterized protein n=1 Tax=Scheffersomyces amazonensis TaxID=1078765 RepID=UPI00315CEB63